MKHALFALLLTVLAFASAQETPCEAGFRLFDHKLLATEPVCIPENPKRVALVDEKAITAYSLGVETVTMNSYLYDFAETYPFALDAAARERMVDIGRTGEASGSANAPGPARTTPTHPRPPAPCSTDVQPSPYLQKGDL